jgi:hypothetical protein
LLPWPVCSFKCCGCASKHKAMSHERMPMSARQLEGEIRALLCKAEIIDALEEGQHVMLTCGSTWPHAERAGLKRAKA